MGGSGDGGGVEAALEVEVEDSIGVLHLMCVGVWELGVLLGFTELNEKENMRFEINSLQ